MYKHLNVYTYHINLCHSMCYIDIVNILIMKATSLKVFWGSFGDHLGALWKPSRGRLGAV